MFIEPDLYIPLVEGSDGLAPVVSGHEVTLPGPGRRRHVEDEGRRRRLVVLAK